MQAKIVRARFVRQGLSVAKWARSNGFSPALVYAVLNGRRRALRGQTHNIAVKLGIKKGVITEAEKLAA